MILLSIALTLLASRAHTDSVPLYGDLGNHHHPISTKVPAAQRYFDQGLRLVFAFNHAEAIRAFNEAARLDPDCAICYWGAALAYGPHVNNGMDSTAGLAAYAALQKAQALASKADPKERAYIDALSHRYAAVPPADRADLDSAYARGMRELVTRYPNDLDAATLYAEALMDLRPWDYWMKNGDPYPGTLEILAQLERVLHQAPDHPGACHYYIHAVEAVEPEKAVGCAERLAALMPGAGHMVHMPGHIYIRVGRWADAIHANMHAVHTDEAYLEGAHPQGMYAVGYYPHNYHFLAFAASMAGRSAQALEAARKTATAAVDAAKPMPPLEVYLQYPFLALVRFGRWADVLQEPLPANHLRYSTAMAHYARGVALAAQGQWADAAVALDTVRAIAGAAKEGETKTVMDIAMHALQGEIAGRRGQLDEAIRQFAEARDLEDRLTYGEPPTWYYPIRHSLGAVLLRAGRGAEAEAQYRQDLRRYPENGWSLFGLAASLRAQNRVPEAETVEARFWKAWATADVTLTASQF